MYEKKKGYTIISVSCQLDLFDKVVKAYCFIRFRSVEF